MMAGKKKNVMGRWHPPAPYSDNADAHGISWPVITPDMELTFDLRLSRPRPRSAYLHEERYIVRGTNQVTGPRRNRARTRKKNKRIR